MLLYIIIYPPKEEQGSTNHAEVVVHETGILRLDEIWWACRKVLRVFD